MADIRIINKNRVIGVDRKGDTTVWAIRDEPGLSWRVLIDGMVADAAKVSGYLPEVVQRKLILAIVKELT